MSHIDILQLIRSEESIKDRANPIILRLTHEVNRSIATSDLGQEIEYVVLTDSCNKLYDAFQALPEDIRQNIVDIVLRDSQEKANPLARFKTYGLKLAVGLVFLIIIMLITTYIRAMNDPSLANPEEFNSGLGYLLELIKIIISGGM